MTAAPKCTMEIELNTTLLFNGLKRKGKVQKREKKSPFIFVFFALRVFFLKKLLPMLAAISDLGYKCCGKAFTDGISRCRWAF